MELQGSCEKRPCVQHYCKPSNRFYLGGGAGRRTTKTYKPRAVVPTRDRQTYLRQFDCFARTHINHIAIGTAGNAALVERHNVLRQGARFVREDVLYLAQLLVQRGGARFRVSFRLVVVHLFIPVDKEGLREPDHLQRERERESV